MTWNTSTVPQRRLNNPSSNEAQWTDIQGDHDHWPALFLYHCGTTGSYTTSQAVPHK